MSEPSPRGDRADSPLRWLEDAAGELPHALAVADTTSLDYAGLDAAVASAATALRAQGVGRGGEGRPPVLAARLRDPFETVRSALAAWRLGCAFLPLAADGPEPQAARLLEQSGANWLLRDPVRQGERPVIEPLQPRPGSSAPHETSSPTRPLEPHEIHLIVGTGGTTGGPRGVMLTGRNLAVACRAGNRRLHFGRGDLWLDCMPLHHVGGLSIPFRTLAAGGAVLLHRGFDAGRVRDALRRERVSHVSFVPAMLAQVLDAAGDAAPPPTLRAVLVGGGPLSRQLALRALAAGWPLCASWGMSETCAQAATRCGLGGDWREGDVGLPLDGLEVRADERGRLHVRGPSVMAGYANPGLEPGAGLGPDGWLQTGDLGGVDRMGRVRIIGRADDVLVTGGENVPPAQVEAALRDCPGMEEAGVTAVHDPVWGDRLVLLYEGRADADGIRDWCRAHLPSAWRPRLVFAVPALPRTAMGKLDRRTLAITARKLAKNCESAG